MLITQLEGGILIVWSSFDDIQFEVLSKIKKKLIKEQYCGIPCDICFWESRFVLQEENEQQKRLYRVSA